MPESLRHPLTRQIAVRLALALLVTILTTVALAVWFYAQANQRFLEKHIRQAEKYYGSALALQEVEWERGAYNFKARLEYSRVLEDSAGRQARLSNFITAQGGVPDYPMVVVLDHEGNRLNTFAYAQGRIPPAVFDIGDSGWAYDETENRLYRAFRQQVWLGAGQNGTLITFRPVDHAVLGALAYPETQLVALWHKRPVASSRGDDGLESIGPEHTAGVGVSQSLLPWSQAQPDNPRVLLRINPDEPFTFAELAQPLGLGALVFALATWITLGLWATSLVRRVLALRAAHQEFAGARDASPRVISALNDAQPDRGDELADLARSLRDMMADVAQHEGELQSATEVLHQSEERYRFLVEGARVVAWEFSAAAARFSYVSPRAEDLLGYPVKDWLQPGFIDLHVHPDDMGRVAEARSLALGTGSGCSLDYRLRHRDGHFIWIHHLSAAAASTDPQANSMIRGILLDISERKQLEQRLALAGLVFETASEGIMLTDAQNRIISVNPAFEAITGYSADEVMGKDPKLLNAGLQTADHYQAMWQGLQQDDCWEGDVWNRRKSGESFAQRLSVSIIRDEWGHIKSHLAMFSDVTTQKRQGEEIEHQAAHDALTGLPNRRLLADRMTQAIARAQRQSGRVGIMMLDLDGFKHINDTLGHRVGDLLLIDTARRLAHCVRESDTVARVGGDEFMVVLPEIQGQNDLQALAVKILDHLGEPFNIEGKELFISASIGLTLYPNDGDTPEVLLAHADTAMYRAKYDGKDTYRFFTAQMHEHALARLQLEDALRRGLRDGEFVLHFQPVFELASGRMAKAEALIRWQDPQRGLIDPIDFIPVAEDTGLIVSIGAWVVKAAAAQAAQWRDLAPVDFRIGVNLSAQQFQRADCVGLWRDALAEQGAKASQFVVEITESLFIDDQGDARYQLNEIKALGIQVAIDDFGTGFSSLSYLKRFPVDTLKIDQSFVAGIPDDPEDTALVEAIVSMSRALSLQVVAEGIETEAQRSFLAGLGCQYGQGYLFGRALPAAEFAKLFLRG
jgi:diguanylate cyclase (GGDEF)-like protein/PAS domain S-box-containing protein